MFLRLTLLLLCLVIPSTVLGQQVRIIQGPNGPQVLPPQQVYPNPYRPGGPLGPSPQQPYVPPYSPPQQPYVPPQSPPLVPQSGSFYFGMTVSPLHSRPGAGLTSRIQSVTPGSPASLAGLEAGDEIISINGRRFPNAGLSANQVANFLDKGVSRNGSTRIGPNGKLETQTSGFASLLVVNVRNGQHTSVAVSPTSR